MLCILLQQTTSKNLNDFDRPCGFVVEIDVCKGFIIRLVGSQCSVSDWKREKMRMCKFVLGIISAVPIKHIDLYNQIFLLLKKMHFVTQILREFVCVNLKKNSRRETVQ